MPRTRPLTPRTRRKSPALHEPTGKIARERTELIRARERMGLTRPQMAEVVGRARSYIYRVEAGIQDPGLATIIAWMGALGPDASLSLFAPHPKLAQWMVLRNIIPPHKLVA
jgi:transcriptional regulator with XRE-family HTH domain